MVTFMSYQLDPTECGRKKPWCDWIHVHGALEPGALVTDDIDTGRFGIVVSTMPAGRYVMTVMWTSATGPQLKDDIERLRFMNPNPSCTGAW